MQGPDLREIDGPLDDIAQGREYGVTLKEGLDTNAADIDRFEAWEAYCDRLEAAADKREADKAEIRAELIEVLKNERRPLRFDWPF
ncbi:MAG: hypothetical protein WBF53_11540 [Litorimonas sp.]